MTMLSRSNYVAMVLALILLLLNVIVDGKPSSDSGPSIAIESKVVGGKPIDISLVRHQVSLRLKSAEQSGGYGAGHMCGGSIISQRLVLTAAHCVWNLNVNPATVFKPSELTVVMGTTYLTITDSKTLQYDIQRVIPHLEFNVKTLASDIALLFINEIIPFDWPTAQPIPLDTSLIAAGSMCNVTGWGNTENGNLSPNLLVGYVPIVSNNICMETYTNIISSMVCAGDINEGGVDACQGDSGGPLECNGMLTGVVSFGNGCGLKEFPGVYTRVSSFIPWIQAQNGTLNYTDYDGGAAGGISDQSRILILSVAFISFFTSIRFTDSL